MKIDELMNAEIIRRLENLEGLTGEEYDNEVRNLEKLYKLRLDELKIKADESNKKKQAINQYVIEGVKLVGQVSICVLPLIAYNKWFNQGLQFEETGTYTAPTVRNLTNKLLPKK